MDAKRMIEDYKRNAASQKQRSEWLTEAKNSVTPVWGRDDIIIERTIRKDDREEKVRNIRITRGKHSINFDVESAHFVSLIIREIAGEYVPQPLREEMIREEIQKRTDKA